MIQCFGLFEKVVCRSALLFKPGVACRRGKERTEQTTAPGATARVSRHLLFSTFDSPLSFDSKVNRWVADFPMGYWISETVSPSADLVPVPHIFIPKNKSHRAEDGLHVA